jgi:hypothetical protein
VTEPSLAVFYYMLNVIFIISYRDTKPNVRQNVDEGSIQVGVWEINLLASIGYSAVKQNSKHGVQHEETKTHPFLSIINNS